VHNRRPGENAPDLNKKNRREAGDRPHDPIPQTLSRAASPKEIYRQCGMIAAGVPLKHFSYYGVLLKVVMCGFS
jgi:hypothetical protein